MGILLTVAVTHPENVPTIDLQYEVIDHYFASDRMSGNVPSYFYLPVQQTFNPRHSLSSETSLNNEAAFLHQAVLIFLITLLFLPCAAEGEHVTRPPWRTQLPTDC